jgi:hypothetical protein
MASFLLMNWRIGHLKASTNVLCVQDGVYTPEPVIEILKIFKLSLFCSNFKIISNLKDRALNNLHYSQCKVYCHIIVGASL